MNNLSEKYKATFDYIENSAPFKPSFAVVLGSGLGDFAEEVDIVKSVSTKDIPGYPLSGVEGHKGFIHFCRHEGKELLLFQGRIHFYEGYSIEQCILPVEIARRLGVKNILLTNAAGGINRLFEPGDLMLITSVNAIFFKKELTDLFGVAGIEQKQNFSKFPSDTLNKKIIEAALDEKVYIKQGVYWFSKGPSYETPAEVKMMSEFNADAVGMSTVHEAVYAAAAGMNTAGISCITNFAAGISDQKLSHAEVTETANMVKDKFTRLVKRIIEVT